MKRQVQRWKDTREEMVTMGENGVKKSANESSELTGIVR